MAELRELPKVQLSRTPIDFGQDCMDPVAKMIVVEAMEYAVETSQRRLSSIGKIFTTVEGSGEKTLAVVNEIKKQIADYPNCKVGKEPLAQSFTPVPPQPPKPTLSRKDIEKTLKQAAEKASTGETTGKKKASKPAPRTQPSRWQDVVVTDKEGESVKYDSPGAAARALGIVTEGAKNMIHVFTRAGFEVSGNGPPKKGVGKFVIKPTGKVIPMEYKLLAKPIEEPVLAPEKKQLRLIKVGKEEGGKFKLIGYDVADDKGTIQKRIPIAEGASLIAEGEAYLG